jgi:hypothetical protein
MTWNDVSVYQFQQIQSIKEENGFDASCKIVGILFNLTDRQVDMLPIQEFNKLLEQTKFLEKQLVSKTPKYIKVRGNIYRFVPDIREIRVGGTGRYITAKHFQKDVINNLHRLVATMVIPQKRGWFGLKDAEYIAQDHDKYADDLLHAKITEVHGALVFFCKVFLTWIETSKDSLIQTLVKRKQMNQYQAEIYLRDLWEFMDGYTKQQSLQNTNE